MPALKVHDAPSRQCRCCATDRLERQTEIFCKVRSAHRELNPSTRRTRQLILLEHAQEHRETAGRVAAGQDDGVTLALADLVRDLGEKLVLKIGIVTEQVGERII